jgi:crossover junction endodeoxyribonuclease RuvC
MSRLFLGIDPGQSGAYAVIDADSKPVAQCRGNESCLDRAEMIADLLRDNEVVFAVLEKVSAMPRQGVSSTFKFGQSFGEAIGVLESCHIRYEPVQPAKWQGALGCRSKGDKNITKHAAQRLFPNQKITHANADAFLIAEYARRLAVERGLV